MKGHDATEQAFKNGYEKGYTEGYNAGCNNVEEIRKKLNDYEKVCGELRFKENGNAVFLIGEDVEYVPRELANGLKNMAVKQAKQDLVKEIFKEIQKSIIHRIFNDEDYCLNDFTIDLDNIKNRYIGE